MLYGGSGSDTLNGGDAADVLIGGYGRDTIDGGNGNDTIRYLSLNDTNDIIDNFVSGDKIDLSAIDADSSAIGNQTFAWGGQVTDFPVVLANSITWYTDGTNVQALVTDSDVTSAEFHLTLTGVTSLFANRLQYALNNLTFAMTKAGRPKAAESAADPPHQD